MSMQDKRSQLNVQNAGRFYFMGAFHYESIRPEFYDLKPLASPSEKEILTRLMPSMKGPAIRQRAQDHLATLK